MAKSVLKNPGRPLNIASAAASRKSKAVFSTLPDVINFYQTGKGLYFGKLDCFCLDK